MVLRPSDEYGGYTMDNYPQNGGGGHHFYESIKTELESFRLRGADEDFSPSVAASSEALLSDDTSSIASKKRIDSMFKTTASVTGDTKRTFHYRVGRQTKSLQADDNNHYNGGTSGGYFDYGYAAETNDRNNNNKNTVQEKIEKMFAEISSSELDTDVSMDSAAPAADTGSNKFHVQYIGCAGLSGKISSLEGLQQPVRDMYFGYRENQHHYRGGYYHDDDEDVRTATRRDFSGLLEISAAGLTIRYRNGLGEVEQRTNAFPSIAVWAALKYVCRRRSPTPQRRIAGEATAGGVGGYEYAFLPLIADPDGSDKAALFRDMDPGDRARLDAAGDHAPVFAVVTRAAGKRLECHGFACETENDALLMAANLYGALVAAMSSTAAVDADVPTADDGAGRLASAPQARRVIRQRNGFTSMSSTAGSSVAGGGVAEEAPALPPPRPPRRNKKSTASSVTSATSVGDEVGVSSAITSVPANGDDGGGGEVCSGAKTFQLTVRQAPSLQRGVCNSSSVAGSAAADAQNRNTRQQRSDGGGDILTKVAIPRSRSFLNSNGLASTKYSRRAAGCGIETAAADRRRRRSNGSGVMGFSEMFNEFRAQEGLNNMDDILNAIINVEGMSYNDLKPIYKEFLMKLALTLTKDELYQRTKAIMTEQKRKRNNKRRPAVATQAAGRGRRLNDKLRDAFDLRAAKSRISAVLLPDFCKRKTGRNRAKQKQQLLQRHQQQKQQRRRRCSCIAGSSAEIRPAVQVDRKPERKFQRRAVAGKRSAAIGSASKGRLQTSGTSSSPVCSTSDDSDFFAAVALRQRQRQHQQLQQQLLKQPPPLLYKKSSKKRSDGGGGRGTATASEGSCLHRASSGYFSCSECSAGDVADDGGGACSYCDSGAAEPTASLVSCSCDSDSCADSDKCYCGKPRRPRNIFDELKSRGFAASESSVSRADSPGTAWKKNELLMLLQQRHDESSPAATGGGVRCGIEPSKSIEYLQMTRRAACPGGADLTAGRAAVGSSSSPSSSLSAATVYSSSSAVHKRRPQPSRGAKHHHRRSGSSGSDNFRAIDYALFAATGDAAGQRKSRGCGGIRQNHRRPDCAPSADGRRRAAAGSSVPNRRSYSSEAVHMTGCRVQYGGHARQPALVQHTKLAARRHSVHDGGVDDVLSSFFKSGIENSLGYYP
ncbi:hypothetical protein AGLY_001293 [Aphis glycines]|uniref:PID domain-containing protein n=1 Tax=Aphis glycines TaxID=307491 RepID=A0A6G0UAE7_APHGL|nr:hypothetical protein AGLY_001293 [Aphis glycines]